MVHIPHLPSTKVTLHYPGRKRWVFPADEPFIQYEPSDEEWCRHFGIGHEVEDEVVVLADAVLDLGSIEPAGDFVKMDFTMHAEGEVSGEMELVEDFWCPSPSPRDTANQLAADCIALHGTLSAAIDELYPFECVVRVDNPQFHGYGIACRDDHCPLYKLPVLVESGNVWWYELDTICERVRDPSRWPWWIRQKKLAWLREKTKSRQR